MKKLFAIVIVTILCLTVIPASVSGVEIVDEVYSLDFSPTNYALASGSDDGNMRVWNATTGKLIKRLYCNSAVLDVEWSPDGSMLVSGCEDGNVFVWDTVTWKVKEKLSGHTDAVNSLSWSSDSNIMVSCGDDKFVRVWNIQTCEEIKSFEETKKVTACDFSYDGQLLAYGLENGMLKILNTTTWNVTKIYDFQDVLFSLEWSPNSRVLACGSKDNTVKIWDTDDDTLRNLTGHSDWVYTVAWSKDGKMLASSSADNTVIIWNTTMWNKIKSLQKVKKDIYCVSWSYDGKLLATGSAGQWIRVYNISSWELIQKMPDRTIPMYIIYAWAGVVSLLVGVLILFSLWGKRRFEKDKLVKGEIIFKGKKWPVSTSVMIILILSTLPALLFMVLSYGWTETKTLISWGIGMSAFTMLLGLFMLSGTPQSLIIYSKGMDMPIPILQQIVKRKKRYLLFDEIVKLSPKYRYDWFTKSFVIFGYEITIKTNENYDIIPTMSSTGFGKIGTERFKSYLTKAIGEKRWNEIYTETPPMNFEEWTKIETYLKTPFKWVVAKALGMVIGGSLFFIIALFYTIRAESMICLMSLVMFTLVITMAGVSQIVIYNQALGKYRQLKMYEKKNGEKIYPDIEVKLPSEKDFLREIEGYSETDWRKLEYSANNYKVAGYITLIGMLCLVIGLYSLMFKMFALAVFLPASVILIITGMLLIRKCQVYRRKVKDVIKLEHKTGKIYLPKDFVIKPSNWVSPMIVYRNRPQLTPSEIDEIKKLTISQSDTKLSMIAAGTTVGVIGIIFISLFFLPFSEYIKIAVSFTLSFLFIWIPIMKYSMKRGFAYQKLEAIKDYEEETGKKILPEDFE